MMKQSFTPAMQKVFSRQSGLNHGILQYYKPNPTPAQLSIKVEKIATVKPRIVSGELRSKIRRTQP